MSNDNDAMLVRLEDTKYVLSDRNEDLRGRTVIDSDGKKVGRVEGLYVDTAELRVRLLEIGSGGFLGLGEQTRLVPVDTITAVNNERVVIDRTGDVVAGSAGYDPALSEPDEHYFEDVYNYYGVGMFWAPGYVDPRLWRD